MLIINYTTVFQILLKKFNIHLIIQKLFKKTIKKISNK